MKALVLCAGYGTRLGSLTNLIPKPMLPLGGKPMLAHTLHYLVSQGIREIAVNLHYRPETIRDHFGDGSRFGVALTYSEEPDLRGTAGAVSGLRDFFEGEEAFLVLYGDVLTNQALDGIFALHRDNEALATLVVHRRANSNSRVTMNAEGRITAFEERPQVAEPAGDTWVNSGIQILGRDIFEHIPERLPSDLPRDVYVPSVQTGRLFGHPLSGSRIAIDSPARYQEAERAVLEGRFDR
ncbi:MAG: nucleotidyltransferase family protein [Rhodothermales bacterium]